jgi:hypothetical protein
MSMKLSTLAQVVPVIPSPTRALPALVALLGLVAARDASAITFGEYDGDAHPEVGGLMVEYGGAWGWPVCSGALVYVDAEAGYGLFLTAGHCLESIEGALDAGAISDFGVNFDEVPDFFAPVQYSATDWSWVYEYTHPATDTEDRAVIRFGFDDASALPEPAQLADADFLDSFTHKELKDGSFVVVGYGATVDRMGGDHYYEDRRQYASPEYINLIGNQVKMQQVGPAGHGGGCYADSGGPLYWVDDDGNELLVATVWGGHSECYAYGRYNRIDNDESLEFIDDAKE